MNQTSEIGTIGGYGGAGGSLPNSLPNVPAREAQVPQQWSQLSKAVEETRALVSELKQRLNSVTRSEPEAAESNKPQPEECLVPMAEGIRALRKSLNGSNLDLRRLLQRAEI